MEQGDDEKISLPGPPADVLPQRKNRHFFVVLGLVFVVSMFAALFAYAQKEQAPFDIVLYVDDVALSAELALTERQQQEGLSGRLSMGRDYGMLFAFPEPTQPSFWMKDMFFPVDILWIDDQFTVVSFNEVVRPATYPVTYTPSTPVRYVLEVNAGWVKANDVDIGSTVSFTLN
jgi:uncharacterized protein